MASLWLDVRWSVRTLAKRPVGSLAIVAILASAIGVATVLGAAFVTIVYDLPPVDSPAAIARVWRADDTRPAGHREPSASDFLTWKDAPHTLTALTAWVQRQAIVGGADGQTVATLLVTSEYFHLTGQSPRLGRAFTAREFEPLDVAIISDRLWRDRFNSDPAIIGRRMAVDVKPSEIIGVMPPGFWFPSRGIDIWLPLRVEATTSVLDMAGRLAPGATVAEAQSEFNVLALRGDGSAGAARIARTLLRSVPAEAKVKMAPGLEGLIAPAFMILLIACANVGNLLIIRTITRERELSIRAALGATAARLARLSLVETAVLGSGAGILGLLLATWGMTLLRLRMASTAPSFAGSIRIGPSVVALAAMTTLVTLIGTGLVPALSGARHDAWASLSGHVRRPVFDRFRYGIGDLFVVVQLGLAVVLVLVSALFIRLFAEIERVIRPSVDIGVYAARLVTPGDLDRALRAETYEHVLDQVAAIGGVDAAALATELPLGSPSETPVIAASTTGSPECRMSVEFVSAGYFDTLDMRLDRGTIPKTIDGNVVVVSRNAAEKCWSTVSMQEWRMRMASGPSTAWMPVVGVAANPVSPRPAHTKELRIGEPVLAWVIGYRDWPQSLYLLIRPRAGAVSASNLTSVTHRASLKVAMEPVIRLQELFDAELAGRKLGMDIIAAVALLALVLSFTGVYAALSHSCSLRIVELGVRLALGADPWRLVVAAVSRDMLLVAIGIVAGLVGTIWVTAMVWRDLLVISAMDPHVWVAVCAILGCAGLLASIGPALRAVRIDPIRVLRAE